MKNILLVDDDNIFNFLNTKLLRQSGIADEIHTALNGKEALDLLNNYYTGAFEFWFSTEHVFRRLKTYSNL